MSCIFGLNVLDLAPNSKYDLQFCAQILFSKKGTKSFAKKNTNVSLIGKKLYNHGIFINGKSQNLNFQLTHVVLLISTLLHAYFQTNSTMKFQRNILCFQPQLDYENLSYSDPIFHKNSNEGLFLARDWPKIHNSVGANTG